MPSPCSKKDGKSGLAVRVGRGSVSNENNVLLDPEVLTDYPTQVLVLTVLVGFYLRLSYSISRIICSGRFLFKIILLKFSY